MLAATHLKEGHIQKIEERADSEDARTSAAPQSLKDSVISGERLDVSSKATS